MKNARIFSTIYSLVTGLLGFTFLFLPNYFYSVVHSTATGAFVLQLIGGLLFGIAMLNWTSRAQPIGGIYSRPLVFSNFTFLLVGLLASLKAPATLIALGPIGWVLGGYLIAFGLAFTILLFKGPI